MPSQPILISIMGLAGSEKITFVSTATNRTDLEIGHGILSCKSQNLRIAKARSLKKIAKGTKNVSGFEIDIDDK